MAERSTIAVLGQRQSDNLVHSSLRAGASMIAVGFLLASASAYAQDNSTTTTDDDTASNSIVVTGIRASLANSQDIKRDSDTVVDAITAADIGALPDRSVTEALQRVPGVSINRFAGSNDPDHFSVEGSGVVVRGLNFVRSEFNGRTAFAAGVGGQALNFADVPSELLGSVIISKNSTADMIEGGLAGTVNLNTRKPFDNMGFHVGFSAEANYGDFAKEWTPTGSFLISNTWDTDSGTFGLLGSVSYSRIKSRADGLQVTNFQTRDNDDALQSSTTDTRVCRNPLPSDEDILTLPAGNSACGSTGTPGADGFADYAGTRYAPVGGQFRTQEFDRKRDGIAFAAQWESTDRGTRVSLDYIRSHSTNNWGEYTYETGADLSEYNTYPIGCKQNDRGPYALNSDGIRPPNTGGAARAECPIGEFTNYTYDDQGLFESGYITSPSDGWRGATENLLYVPIGGMQQTLGRRQVAEETTNSEWGFNLKSELTDRLSINFDAQYAQSRKQNVDFSVQGSLYADEEVDLTGEYPVIIPHAPQAMAYSWATPSEALNSVIIRDENNQDTGLRNDSAYFSDPRFQFWRSAMDHIEDSEGSQYALKADLEYAFDDDAFIRKVKFGGRYADRDQTVRYSTYNWGMLSEVWTGNRPINFADTGSENSSYYNFPDFFRGAVPGPQGAFYYNGDLIGDYQNAGAFFQDIYQQAKALGASADGSAWEPLSKRADNTLIPGTPFLKSEIQPIKQEEIAFYGMATFGSDTMFGGDTRISGNIGLRWVKTNINSSGDIGVGTASSLGVGDPYGQRCQVVERPYGDPVVPGGICTDEDEYNALQAWADGHVEHEVINHSYDYLLPSFNLKVGVSDELLFRFAASKVLTRPDNAYIRDYFTAGLNSNGVLEASAGEPTLLPATAWQFDLTAEWYFARVGSLTVNAFYKDVANFFFQNVRTESITNGSGVARDIIIRGPANYEGHGKIKGFEVAYQQTYDFLPGFLSGLGMSANYTFIDSKGLPNTFLNGGDIAHDSNIAPGDLPLEQLSKHNVNVAGFYENKWLSVRAAYNWRSKFLLTASDVIFPYYAIFNDATGQLDASIFVNVTDNIKVGVQGVNLLNEVTKTLQAYTGDPEKLAPRSYFMNDRRFSFVLRGNF